MVAPAHRLSHPAIWPPPISRRCSKALRTRRTSRQALPPAQEYSAHALGYCVLAGSLVRSVPQIARIARSRSVQGLSLTAHVNELLSYGITSAYNLRKGCEHRPAPLPGAFSRPRRATRIRP